MIEGNKLPFVEALSDGLRLNLHVQPAASRSELCGQHGDSLKVKVRAHAIEGAANNAVREFLAELFHVPKSSVSIIKGETSRTKTVHVRGDTNKLLNRLTDALT